MRLGSTAVVRQLERLTDGQLLVQVEEQRLTGRTAPTLVFDRIELVQPPIISTGRQ